MPSGGLTFTSPPKWCTCPLAVDESLTQQAIQEIMDQVDDEIADAVGIIRNNFVVHVFQGRETAVYSDNEFSDNGRDH